MNTADRSVALVDHALRRRFHFVPLRPDPQVLRRWLEANDFDLLGWVADVLALLNRRLEEDHVEWHLHIGHGHFMPAAGRLTEDRVELVWEHSILPTLEEYFYDRADRLERYALETLRRDVVAVGS
jgi:5-methylcytosine-specific restriction protein B